MSDSACILGVEAFRDVLAKGLGRTMLALREPDGVTRYADAILDACLHDQRFDRQCEDGRAPYLIGLIEAAGLDDRVLSAILEALPSREDSLDAHQTVDLLGEFAKKGHDRAWNALAALSSEGDSEATECLARSGAEGLEWVAEHVLPRLSDEERWHIRWWLPDEEADDVTDTQRRLRAVYEAVEERREAEPSSMECPKYTPRQFLDGYKVRWLSRSASRAFAEEASEEEFLEAAEHFLVETKPGPIRSLGRVFEFRRFPLPLGKLFEQADDEHRGRAVCGILGAIHDPQVREFALPFIRRQPLPPYALATLKGVFQPGDEAVIEEILPKALEDQGDELHFFIIRLLELMSVHEEGEWQPFAEWIYEHSPCSLCRGTAVRWMVQHGALPDSVREEGVYDAESEVRELVLDGGTAM